MGVILTNENVFLADKERHSDMVAKLAEWMELDGVLITEEGYGNPDTDLMMNCRKVERKGTKVVLITDEFPGKDGKSQSLADTCDEATALASCGQGNMTLQFPAMEIKSRPYDYYYHYRADQNVPDEEEISTLAAKHGIAVKDFQKAPYLSLGMDGITEVEEGRSFHYERIPFKCEGRFLSEESYEALTGEKIALEKGSYMAVCKSDGTGLQFLEETAQVLTNMETFQSIPVKFAGYAHYDLLTDSSGYYVLNSEDYESVGQDLGGEWMGEAVFFNIDGEDSYEFAQDFFHTLISSFGPECEIPSYYDRVSKYYANSQGEVYWGDTPDMTEVS